MSLGDTLKRFTLADNFILNTLGNLVGIKNPNANGNDLRVDNMPAIVVQSGVPTILPSSGSANGSGVITHTTALPFVPSGPVQVYLPVGVVTGGSQGSGAGLYTAVYSSTTVCQISGTGITTTAGAYTQTTAAVNLVTTVVPPGSMGINGRLRARSMWTHPSNANVKTEALTIGGTQVQAFANTTTTNLLALWEMFNRGVQNLNVRHNLAIDNTPFSGGFAYTSFDMSLPQTFGWQAQLAVATDYVILEAYGLENLPVLQ